MPIRVTGTGPKFEAKSKYHNRGLPTRQPGEHLWVVVSMYRVTPNRERYDLDTENLLNIEGPGCYWCEQPWSEPLATAPCRGAGT